MPTPNVMLRGAVQALSPSAVRVERSRVRHPGGGADQTAVTMWFGSGPALPGFLTLNAPAVRSLVRVTAGVLGAAALAAMTVVAAQREAERINAPRSVPRLEG
ncbi:MAG: hypothetical protein JOZ46_02680 [Candidatus Dormibacteraeota bacterium]|nr:hypothetical protein [Candidatus Dormibacteraeota bacterium]MBV9524704.1 hypothetical protein [Candidatus Dormibacteraeota bacterium]